MPVIHVHYIFDLTADITNAAAENMNLPCEYVQVWLHQTSAEDHSVGGIILEEKLQKKENV